MNQRQIVVLGGYGTFGRHISSQLALWPGVQVKITGRQPEKAAAFAHAIGAKVQACDTQAPDSLRRAVQGAWLVVNATGPFQAGNYAIPRAAMDAGSHYIDIADGRQYVAQIVGLHEQAQARRVFVCVGASTTPAITSAMVDALAANLAPLRSIRVALNAGNKNAAGVSTIATILSYVGRPMDVWLEGAWQNRRGWSGGEFVKFPAPVGRRRVQWCDTPDLALFPDRYGAEDVSFKAGVELTILNYAIGLLGQARRLMPLPLPSLARPLVAFSKLFKPFGTWRGGCGAWVTDIAGQERSLALVAHENGPRIPGSPAILLAQKLLRGDITAVGAFPCMGFLSIDEFATFLEPFNIHLVAGEDGNWNGQTGPRPEAAIET